MLLVVTYHALGHPFRLSADGSVYTVAQDSDGFLDQCIQTVAGTIVGEREMCMPYGVPDPAWHGLEADDIQAALSLFGPHDVEIKDVQTTWQSELSAHVVVNWDRVSSSTLGVNQP
jgi:hypothetical protein